MDPYGASNPGMIPATPEYEMQDDTGACAGMGEDDFDVDWGLDDEGSS